MEKNTDNKENPEKIENPQTSPKLENLENKNEKTEKPEDQKEKTVEKIEETSNEKNELPEDLDINALKAKMEALQKLLAPRQENFVDLLNQNKSETSIINKILTETETIVKNIDTICEKGIKKNFKDFVPILKEEEPISYKKYLKKIKKIKNKDEKEHVESLVERIEINERRINGLNKFLEDVDGSVIGKNIGFIDEILKQENSMSEHYLDYVFKQSSN